MSRHAENLLRCANLAILEGDNAGAAIFMALLEREITRNKTK